MVYELETITEELASYRLSLNLQKKVVEIRHCLGLVDGYTDLDRYDQLSCIEALVRIRTLSKLGYEDATTKKARRRFADILRIVGALEAGILSTIQGPSIIERLKSIGRTIISVLAI